MRTLERSDSRGTVATGTVVFETALVTPLLVLIVLGIIEMALLMRDNVAVSSLVRDGGHAATATLETVWCMPEKTPFDIDERMSIIGTEGIIHVQDTFPNLGIVSSDKLHSPDTTYWPEFNGVRGGALRDEFSYFANCALAGERPVMGVPTDAAAALEATLAAEESARTGNVIRIGQG